MLLNAPLGVWAWKPLSFLLLVGTSFLLACSGYANGDETPHRTMDRALILGGGGPVGEAWESGVIVGLMEKGVDLSRADLIVGTSAGAIVGARLASRMPSSSIIEAAVARSDGPPPSKADERPTGPPPDLKFLGDKLEEMGAGTASQQSIRAEIGRWAEKVHPVVSESLFVASYRRRFPDQQWPRGYECVAVDTADGSMVVWNETSGVPLALAVASSCALPGVFAPVSIKNHQYMDGGVRSVTNADLARGCKKALVMAPTMGLDDPMAKSFTRPLSAELQTLRDGRCKVELIAPDVASLKAFGPSIGDESHRAPALEAGRIQGRDIAGEITRLWNQ
jgi:NTE family protein